MRRRTNSAAVPPDDLRGAKEYGLRLLTLRGRSEAEMARRLSRRGYDEVTVERAVADLKAVGLLDDREFAQAWVAGRLARGPAGRVRLLWELRRHGVEAETALAAVDEGLDPEAEFEAAWVWARKRAGEAPDREALGRLQAALQRRGFGREIVREVIERLTRESDGSP
jgi:regulatory protein